MQGRAPLLSRVPAVEVEHEDDGDHDLSDSICIIISISKYQY